MVNEISLYYDARSKKHRNSKRFVNFELLDERNLSTVSVINLPTH